MLDVAAVAQGRPVPVRAVAAVAGLVRELLRGRDPYLHLEYPGFPALGVYYRTAAPSRLERLRAGLAYARAELAIAVARLLCTARGRRLVAGIGDVPSLELDLPDRGRLGSPRLTRRYEARLLAAADAVWVVTPEERDYFVRTYDVPPAKFVVVPNGNPRVPAPPPRLDLEPVRIVYPGSLYRDRENLRSVIVPLLDRVTRPVTVTLAGPGGEWIDETFADSRVRWCGTLGDRECFDLVAASDIGLLAYFDDEPYYEIVHPTKLSLYVAATIPIVSGDARYVARFIREHGVGVAVSRAEFVDALVAAVEDSALRRRQSEAAGAIREQFFWDAILGRAAAETRRIAPVRSGA